MKKTFITKIATFALVITILFGVITTYAAGAYEAKTRAVGPEEVKPMAKVTVDNGLGEWRYGTGIGFRGVRPVKTAYSDMDHGSKTHRSSCEIDGEYDSSGWVQARTTSRSKTKGHDLSSTAYCNWSVK